MGSLDVGGAVALAYLVAGVGVAAVVLVRGPSPARRLVLSVLVAVALFAVVVGAVVLADAALA